MNLQFEELTFSVEELPTGKFTASARDRSGAKVSAIYHLGRRDHAEEYCRVASSANRRTRKFQDVIWPRPPGHMTP